MKKILLLIVLSVVISVFSLSAQHANPDSKNIFKTRLDSISYIVGSDVAYTLKKNGMELNTEFFSKGFADAWMENDTFFTTEEAEAILMKYGQELQAARQKEKEEADAAIIAKGKAFLDENKAKDGIMVTESGLQYEILKLGDGEKPPRVSKVTVHYKGMLTDGTVFDSSIERGKPNTFDLDKLIPGWTEGIQLMPVGSKFKFTIPSELAYGERTVGVIPPHAVLVFEVELISFE